MERHRAEPLTFTDEYGATRLAEFFAESPRLLSASAHAATQALDIYVVLKEYYRQIRRQFFPKRDRLEKD